MVSTRNSAKKAVADDDEAPEVAEVSSTKAKTPKKTPKSNRKTKRKEELKSKNTGLGISISIDETPAKGNKIVFDEENLPEVEVQVEEGEGTQELPDTDTNKQSTEKIENDEDDDAVEEVKGSAAREEILEQLKTEEKQSLKAKKKKKRKERQKAEEKVEDDEEDFDEDFFAELEAVREAQDATRKAKQPKGQHTTFVFPENERDGHAEDPSAPRRVEHNIQVVVLPEDGDTVVDNAITAIPHEDLSQAAIMFSRGQLVDGADKGKKRKSKTTPKRADSSWKRSRKMGLLAGSSARFHRMGGRGRPAANFVTSKR